jgi:hypothetical protein
VSTALDIQEAGPLKLPLAEIKIDPELQARAHGVSQVTVREYAEAMRDGAAFPPVVVFKDSKGVHWLADGFHRCAAVAKLEPESGAIAVDVREGSRKDALLHAAGCNASHGLRRSQADRRRAVELLLREPAWAKRTDAWIAKAAAVSAPTVAKLRGTLNISSDAPRETADGRVMDVSGIGTRKADSDDTIATKLTAQIEKLIVQWPDSKHEQLRTLLTSWSEALAPKAAE